MYNSLETSILTRGGARRSVRFRETGAVIMSNFAESGEMLVYRPIAGKGNGLVSDRAFSAGDFLFSEYPFVWARDSSWDSAESRRVGDSSCSECGRFFRLDAPDHVPPVTCAPCGAKYCGAACMQQASAVHHTVLCGHVDAFENTLGPKLTAHMSCAVKIVAKILIDAAAHRDAASTASTPAALDASVERVMGQFAQPLFTHSIHAFRGGREMPESLFADMFLSNYFDGYLLEGYEATCTLLAATAPSGGAVPAFFTQAFYDGVMGMLLTNCQSVLLEQGGQGRRDAGGDGESDGEGGGARMQVKGTALYALYSKANHACEGDWTNRPLMCREEASCAGDGEGDTETERYERVGVNIYAGRNIARGDEVMNCYFAEGSGEGLSKSQRREKLLQYRFLCKCRICLDEASSDSDSDSDSDGDSDIDSGS